MIDGAINHDASLISAGSVGKYEKLIILFCNGNKLQCLAAMAIKGVVWQRGCIWWSSILVQKSFLHSCSLLLSVKQTSKMSLGAPRQAQFSFERQNYYNGHRCQCCDTFIKPTSVELKIQLLEHYYFNTNPIDTLNSLIFVYLPYFWSGELEMVLFCIVSHFLFLMNHSTKLSGSKKRIFARTDKSD